MSKKPVEEQSLSLPFFIVSIGLLLTILYMVYDETSVRRPWKRYQKQFYEIQVDKLSKDLDRAEANLAEQVKGATDYQEAKSELRGLLSKGSKHLQGKKKAQADFEARNIDLAHATELFNFQKAAYLAMRYRVEKAEDEGDPSYTKLAAELAELGKKMDEKQKEMDRAKAAFDAAQKRLLEFKDREKRLQEVIDKYEKDVKTLQNRRDAVKARFL